MSGARGAEPSLADDVKTYLNFGLHRAGMPTEEPTAHWIAERLEKSGYQTKTQRFPIRTIRNPGGLFSAGGVSAEVFPQWLPPVGSLGQTIDAPLLPLFADGSAPSIRLMTKPAPLSSNWSSVQAALVQDAIAKGALALVLAPDDPSGHVFVSNQHKLEPLPIPVALLARRSLSDFAGLADRKDFAAHLTLTGTLSDTSALNVIGRKPGRGRTIVISTPLTGWFSCGGERGPGIAVLLRMAAVLAKFERPVVVLATGSHEIGHLGMEHALKHGAPPPSEVAFWFHFGASLATTKLDAAYGVTSPQMLLGTTMFEDVLRSELSPLVRDYHVGTVRTPGESGQLIRAGHTRFAGMIGTFPTFHTPADHGEAIDYALLEKIFEASATVLKHAAEMAD